MKKLMNSADRLVADWLDGFSAAHADIVVMAPGRKYLRRREPSRGKVALISGGGSGHEPLHAGFVGRGMLDAACPGQIFTSPTPDQIVEAAQALAGEAGALFIVKNYAGDRMNFEMAAEIAACRNETLVVDDDISDEQTTRSIGRRGVAGTMIVEKMLGAAAEAGADLPTCLALGAKVKARTRSIGVALSYCTLPTGGARSFTLGPDEMELGVGIHGEPGRRKVKFAEADAIAEELVGAIVADLASPKSSEALLLINGFGGSPLIELYVMCNSARQSLERRGVRVVRTLVGNFVTSLDMMGCSITVSLLDSELVRHWDSPVRTAALSW
jgi:dihydroxyacetone kinase-like protein